MFLLSLFVDKLHYAKYSQLKFTINELLIKEKFTFVYNLARIKIRNPICAKTGFLKISIITTQIPLLS